MQNPTRQDGFFQAIGINNEGMNEFKAEKSNEDCIEFGSKMQLYNVAAQTERGIDLAKVLRKKHQAGEVGRCSAV